MRVFKTAHRYWAIGFGHSPLGSWFQVGRYVLTTEKLGYNE